MKRYFLGSTNNLEINTLPYIAMISRGLKRLNIRLYQQQLQLGINKLIKPKIGNKQYQQQLVPTENRVMKDTKVSFTSKQNSFK